MSSVVEFVTGDKFILRVWKYALADPSVIWTNAYEFKAIAAGVQDDLTAAGGAFFGFEQTIHLTDIKFFKFSWSTWEADSHPYDPDTFYENEFGPESGARVPLTDPLPLEVCWSLRRAAATGRSGKIYLRGCLVEGDVERGGRGYTFTDPLAMRTLLAGAVTSNIDNYLSGTGVNLQLSMIAKVKDQLEIQIRDVKDIVSRGVTNVQMKHAWYNRHKILPG